MKLNDLIVGKKNDYDRISELGLNLTNYQIFYASALIGFAYGQREKLIINGDELATTIPRNTINNQMIDLEFIFRSLYIMQNSSTVDTNDLLKELFYDNETEGQFTNLTFKDMNRINLSVEYANSGIKILIDYLSENLAMDVPITEICLDFIDDVSAKLNYDLLEGFE